MPHFASRDTVSDDRRQMRVAFLGLTGYISRGWLGLG
ncbi:hypothetical protein CGRA01v4_05015 [Colletotrichum graminicola]|nr:hypothetical protein CGRA01v4_05015 [Colletotrichum graminicola]